MFLSSFARKAPFSGALLRPLRLAPISRAFSSNSAPRRPNRAFAWLAAASVVAAGYVFIVRPQLTEGAKKAQKLNKPPSLKENLEKCNIQRLSDDYVIFFVLGGPGSGKGTNCARLVQDFGFVHLSAGDLLREEQQRPGSLFGDLIRDCIKEGLIVPKEVTVALLYQAIQRSGKRRFLIDGFPRAMDQALLFEESIAEGKGVLYFECPEQELLARLIERGKTSGRADDNLESIKKRFQTFKQTSFPVIKYFEQKEKVHTISCIGSTDQVYDTTKKLINKLL